MPSVIAPLGFHCELVPTEMVLVPSNGELAPTIWFINGVLVLVTYVICWSPVGLETTPLFVTVIAFGTSPSPQDTTRAKS